MLDIKFARDHTFTKFVNFGTLMIPKVVVSGVSYSGSPEFRFRPGDWKSGVMFLLLINRR